MKDLGNRTARWHTALTLIVKQAANLTRPPARMTLTQTQKGLLFGVIQLGRAVLGTTRKISQTIASLLAMARQPLIAGLSADRVTLELSLKLTALLSDSRTNSMR